MLRNKRSPCNKKPTHCNEEQPPLPTTRGKPPHRNEDLVQPKIHKYKCFLLAAAFFHWDAVQNSVSASEDHSPPSLLGEFSNVFPWTSLCPFTVQKMRLFALTSNLWDILILEKFRQQEWHPFFKDILRGDWVNFSLGLKLCVYNAKYQLAAVHGIAKNQKQLND